MAEIRIVPDVPADLIAELRAAKAEMSATIDLPGPRYAAAKIRYAAAYRAANDAVGTG